MASFNWTKAIIDHLSLDATTATARGDLLALIGGGVQSAIEAHTNRLLEIKDVDEVYSGTGRDFLFLRHDPVHSVSRLIVNGSDVEVGDPTAPTYPPAPVVVFNGNGLQYTNGLVFPVGVSNVRVQYRAGMRVIPPDLVLAGVLWGAAIFKNRERIGITSQSVGQQTVSFTEAMPPLTKKTLDAWVRWTGRSC